jgi:hypothetical protein
MSKSEANSNGESKLKNGLQRNSIPEWHKELLDSRRKAVEAGHEKVLDWDRVKESLGKREAPRRKRPKNG